MKITLMDLQPSIWRRVEVEDCTLLRLHKIIQVSMGWKNRRAWAFMIDGQEYGDDVIDSGGIREFASARKTKLSQFVNRGVKRFLYVYDLGDNWQHVIQVEKVLETDHHVEYPRCIKGSRACPPEDCGGPWGYEKFLDIIPFPDHEQYEDMMALVGGEFDSEAFDTETVNQELAKSAVKIVTWRTSTVGQNKLKLGKGASFFVKSQLLRLDQEEETWEAGTEQKKRASSERQRRASWF